jgi:CBS domain-containing protein
MSDLLLLSILVLCSIWLGTRLKLKRPFGKLSADAERGDALKKAAEQAIFSKRQSILLTMVGNIDALHEGAVEVRHLMSASPSSVNPNTPLYKCAELMAERRYRHLLVCDGANRLRGVISNRDLGRTDAGVAADVMTRHPVTVTPDTRIGPAVTQILRKRISCLPVVEKGQLVGVLTTTDLLLALQCSLQALEKSNCRKNQGAGDELNEFVIANGETSLELERHAATNSREPVAMAP